jgi:hypothetical protein
VLVKLRHEGGGEAVDVLGSLFHHAETSRPSRRLSGPGSASRNAAVRS